MSFPDSIINKFIVREVIMDPSHYTSLDSNSLDSLFKTTGSEPGFFSDVIDPASFKKKLLMAPRNTIIGTIATPSNSTTKSSEGDPRYREDLSRVYVSMKTDGDSNFGFADSSSLPNPGQSLNPVAGKPYVVIKSNEARIITRNDGSVRIIKEGDRSGDHSVNQAIITMQPDGTIMIDGPKIIVGSGNAKGNGQGDQVLIGGSSASEPIVLGNALKGLIQELITQIKVLTVPTGVGPSGPPVNAVAFESINQRLNTILSQVGKTK